MLEKVKLINYKSHKYTELNFDNSRLHAVVGKNSSGKTSVLQALHNLCRLADSKFSTIFKDDQSPQFITTIGEKNMAVTTNGFWEFEERQHWEVQYGFWQKNKFWEAAIIWNMNENKTTSSGWDMSLISSPNEIRNSLKDAV